MQMTAKRMAPVRRSALHAFFLDHKDLDQSHAALALTRARLHKSCWTDISWGLLNRFYTGY